jgi:hypothetical protein
MSPKCKILVLFLALGVFAAPENLQKSSAAFSFVQAGVINPYAYWANGSYFSCRKIANGKQGMVFSWSILGNTAQIGKLSIYTVSGKMIRSFDLTSRDKSVSWNMPQGKLASGVYFAVLNFGLLKKNLKIMY